MADKELKTTQSVCPVCLQRLPAQYISQNGQVYLVKTCPEHGYFKTLVWQNETAFLDWQQNNTAQAPIGNNKPVQKGCPFDCGLCEGHIQSSCCVLFEVTKRCNLKCPICYASANAYTEQSDVRLATIELWYNTLLEKGGPFNIQLSGGEPTVRDDLAKIIEMGKQKGFPFFQLNTNGIRIAQDITYLKSLKKAGLNTVFLQFDGLEEDTYQKLRGQNILAIKKQAIENCKQVQIGVVLVPTVHPQYNLAQMGALVRFAQQHMPTVRGVHFQPISYFGRYDTPPTDAQRTTIPMLLHALEEQLDGKVKYTDFSAASAEHAMCSFHAEYRINKTDWILKKSSASCCCSSDLKSSDVTRDAVALKWSLMETDEPKLKTHVADGFDLSALDDFLKQQENNTFSLSGMAFQDAWTFDIARVKRCNVHILNQKGELIPFCAMNLTNTAGKSLYRTT